MLFCDWSARDLQGAEMTLNLGPAKGKDRANGFGPWLVTTDELAERASGHGYDVAMAATVNGASYSRGNLADLYWSFGEMIAYASRGTRVRARRRHRQRHRRHGLHPGALPGARRRAPTRTCSAGDRVHLEADLLGAIDARIAARPPTRPPAPTEAHHMSSRSATTRDEITEPGARRLQEVADGVYAYIQPDGTWWINNTGFVVGPQGVISIDACSTERRTRAYLARHRGR